MSLYLHKRKDVCSWFRAMRTTAGTKAWCRITSRMATVSLSIRTESTMRETLKMIVFMAKAHSSMQSIVPLTRDNGRTINLMAKASFTISTRPNCKALSTIRTLIKLNKAGSNSKVNLIGCREFREWYKRGRRKDISNERVNHVGNFFKRIAKWRRGFYQHW